MNKAAASQRNCWIVIGVAVALFLARNVELYVIGRDLAALEQQSLYPLKQDTRSPTGYRWGQRSEILSPDGYHWTMQTQRMLAEGNLRVRKVDYDNHPDGREVHWSSSMHAWLGGLSWLWSAASGVPVPIAVEHVALFANPLLCLLSMLVLVPLVWKWKGGAAAAVLAVSMVMVAPFVDMFGYADPDHHGLVGVCCLATVLFLGIGGGAWVKNDEDDGAGAMANGLPCFTAARRWFVASGVAGGAGLWISSATQVPVLIGIGFGVAVGMAWFGRKALSGKNGIRHAPELWRVWGLAGGSTSVFFYLLEYFPSHFGMRLEVNHPLYAVAWAGGGELLFRLSRWLTGGGFAKTGREQALALAAVVGVLILPLTIVVAGDRTFWVGDRLLWALHRDYIVEFCNVFRRFADTAPSRWLSVFNPLPLLVLLLCWRAFRSSVSVVWKVRVVMALAPAIVVLALAVFQVRWMGIASGLWIAVLVLLTGLPGRGEMQKGLTWGWKVGFAVLALLVVLPWASQFIVTGVSIARGQKGFSKLSLRFSVMRDVARWLRSRTGDSPAVVLSGPGATTAFIYHGGFQGVGTLYWENKDGLHSMVEIFSTSNDSIARELMARHGVTHIVVVSWDAFAEASARLALGLKRGEEPPENTFITRLAKGHGCPFWLRPVYYPAPQLTALKDDYVLVYEVVPEQSREEAALRYGQLMFERGDREDAEKFLNVLVRHFPNYLPGWVALAQVQLSLEHADGFRASRARIGALQSEAGTLALDDRIGLATVLAVTGDTEGMKQEIARCVAAADETSLRKLNSNALLWFVIFAQDSGEGMRRPDLMRLAAELLPPEMLKQTQAERAGRLK